MSRSPLDPPRDCGFGKPLLAPFSTRIAPIFWKATEQTEVFFLRSLLPPFSHVQNSVLFRQVAPGDPLAIDKRIFSSWSFVPNLDAFALDILVDSLHLSRYRSNRSARATPEAKG
jgi:hypothetical protein